MAIPCEISEYQLLKDFLGPIATIVASLVAVGVTAYFAYHQKRIAEHQKRIAEEQKDTAKHKLRYDLYQRRFEIFNSIYPFYYAMIEWEGTPEQRKAKDRFFGASEESRFLFTKESRIEDLLKKLNKDGSELIVLKENREKSKGNREMILHEIQENTRILNEFEVGLGELKNAMYPYLNFSKVL